MKHVTASTRWGMLAIVTFLFAPSPARAQFGVGTWTRTDAQGKGLTMTISACCNGGYRLVYSIPVRGQTMSLTVDSPMDGTEVPALIAGKPSGETMAIKRLDARHYTAVVKMAGQPFSTSSGTLSADGKTLTVESTPQGGAKITETWVRQ